MQIHLTKSELQEISHVDLNGILEEIKSKSPSPEKIYPSKNNIIARNTKAVIYYFAKKYKIDIENILNIHGFIAEVESKTDELCEIGLLQEVRKVLKMGEYGDYEKLYGYILNISEKHKMDVMESYIRALDNSAIVQIVDKNGIVKYVNDMYRKISGDQRTLVGRKVSAMGGKLYHNNEFWRDLWETVTSGEIWQGVIQNPRMDNKEDSYYTFTTITPIKNDLGEVLEYITVKFDITKMRKLENELKFSNKRFQNILNSTNQGFWVINENLEIQEINESLCDMLGYKKHELMGKNIRNLLDDKNKAILDEQVAHIKETSNRKYHIDFTKKDGSYLPVVLKASSLFDKDGNFQEAIAFITDISEIRDYQEQLYEISIKDELTGLWNRRLFDYKLKNYFDLINTENSEISNICVCLIDIDYFKRINDGLGHDVGDIVLKEFGQRLLHISRENIEVFRVGGEEFGIIGYNIEINEFYTIIDNFRIYNEAHPIAYSKGEVKFTISGGITSYDKSKMKTKSPQILYKEADGFLYMAKGDRRNNIKSLSTM